MQRGQVSWNGLRTSHQALNSNQFRSCCQEVFYKKGVLRNFAKFTGKHLCQSFFFNKVAVQIIQWHYPLNSQSIFFFLFWTPPHFCLFHQILVHWVNFSSDIVRHDIDGETYSEHRRTAKIERFWKKLHLRCFTGFWICLWLLSRKKSVLNHHQSILRIKWSH